MKHVWGQGEGHIGFWWVNFKYLGVGGRMILKLVFNRKNCGVEWIDLAQDRQRWRALVNALLHLRFP